MNSFETAVDILFVCDMVFAFMSAYIDTGAGVTIKKPSKIASNYMKNGFIFDFLSTLPIVLKPLINALTEPGSAQ